MVPGGNADYERPEEVQNYVCDSSSVVEAQMMHCQASLQLYCQGKWKQCWRGFDHPRKCHDGSGAESNLHHHFLLYTR